jgi:hypothetical protein
MRNRVIWKYELEACSNQRLSLPSNFEILSIEVFGEKIRLYVIADPSEPEIKIEVTMCSEGDLVFNTAEDYLGFIKSPSGRTLHVFWKMG